MNTMQRPVLQSVLLFVVKSVSGFSFESFPVLTFLSHIAKPHFLSMGFEVVNTSVVPKGFAAFQPSCVVTDLALLVGLESAVYGALDDRIHDRSTASDEREEHKHCE